jgi:hypothetical protein
MPQIGAEPRNVSQRQVRLSTNATLEQNLRFTSRCVNLDIHATHASFLQLSKTFVPFNTCRSERLHSRWSAISVWSRKREKTVQTIKNPARAPGESVQLNGCARSSISFYPVFVTNLTSCEKADPVRQQTSLRIRALPTSGESNRISINVKSLSKKFIASICEFQCDLWKLQKTRIYRAFRGTK